MANELLEYKCPCCGGALTFQAALQKVKCPYCDTEFETDSLKSLDEGWAEENSAEWAAGGSSWTEEEKEFLSEYVCESCGGELVTEETTASSFCPYCGNPVILKGRLSGGLKPDFVIPFQMEKSKVNDAFAAFVKGKLLLPKAFREECKTEEIKGLYVPFWVYDAEVTGRVQYHATKVRCWTDGEYSYTETRHYAVYRSADLSFEHIPADASKKMADDLMESIEPYDFSAAKPFQSAFLSGFYSDKYDVEQKDTYPRVNERMKRGAEDALRDTVHGYSTVFPEKSTVNLKSSKVVYTLYPVWTMQKSWKDKTYSYAVNGQTGKVAGELPFSVAKLLLFSLLAALLGGLIGFGIFYFLEFELTELIVGTAVVALLFGIVTGVLLKKQIKTVAFQDSGRNYLRGDGVNLLERRDVFLYRNVTRQRLQPKENPSARGRK